MPDDLRGPTPELARSSAPVALPSLPIFELAPLHASYHTPLELRQRGGDLLGHELLVKGFVTGIYDCVADLSARHPGWARGRLIAEIDRDIAVCQRPKFYLGQSERLPLELSITVTDVPRPPIHREAKDMTEADYLRWPKVPKLTLADYVGVTGTWTHVSPHGERDANGLLVYASLTHEPVTAEARTASQTLSAAEPEIAVDTQVPLRQLIGNERWNASIDHLNACTHAVVAKRFDVAISECQAAAGVWPENHLAWYGIASAQLARSAWADAIGPARRAVELRPDQAMYQLYYGIALFEAREQLDDAREAFRRAVKLMPGLWRARYYLARSELEHGEAAMAAGQLNQTIASNPSYTPAYLVLAELYLRWGYRQQARAVTETGTQRLTGEAARELWFELGTIEEADRALPAAIAAYTKVIDGDPLHIKARLARGRLLIDIGKREDARGDLQIAAGTREPALELERQLAMQLLWAISPRDSR